MRTARDLLVILETQMAHVLVVPIGVDGAVATALAGAEATQRELEVALPKLVVATKSMAAVRAADGSREAAVRDGAKLASTTLVRACYLRFHALKRHLEIEATAEAKRQQAQRAAATHHTPMSGPTAAPSNRPMTAAVATVAKPPPAPVAAPAATADEEGRCAAGESLIDEHVREIEKLRQFGLGEREITEVRPLAALTALPPSVCLSLCLSHHIPSHVPLPVASWLVRSSACASAWRMSTSSSTRPRGLTLRPCARYARRALRWSMRSPRADSPPYTRRCLPRTHPWSSGCAHVAPTLTQSPTMGARRSICAGRAFTTNAARCSLRPLSGL